MLRYSMCTVHVLVYVNVPTVEGICFKGSFLNLCFSEMMTFSQSVFLVQRFLSTWWLNLTHNPFLSFISFPVLRRIEYMTIISRSVANPRCLPGSGKNSWKYLRNKFLEKDSLVSTYCLFHNLHSFLYVVLSISCTRNIYLKNWHKKAQDMYAFFWFFTSDFWPFSFW